MNSFKRVRAFQIELELEVLVFEERGKPEYPAKSLSEQRGEPTTNSTHMRRRHPGHHRDNINGTVIVHTTRNSLFEQRSNLSTFPVIWEYACSQRTIKDLANINANQISTFTK